MKNRKGYVIAGAHTSRLAYSYIVWCANGRWVDLNIGKGKVFRTWKQAVMKSEKLGLNYFSTSIIHTKDIHKYLVEDSQNANP